MTIALRPRYVHGGFEAQSTGKVAFNRVLRFGLLLRRASMSPMNATRRMAKPLHLPRGIPLDTLQKFILCDLPWQRAPMSPGERTTPFEATTSSRIRCARLERSTSAAVVIFNFSITGKRLLVASATSSYAGESGPPPIKASIRIEGPGKPVARNTEYNSRPGRVRGPVTPGACLTQSNVTFKGRVAAGSAIRQVILLESKQATVLEVCCQWVIRSCPAIAAPRQRAADRYPSVA